ncbi:hypothetical protein SDC9_16347 [bioreactor metagenome]|jgi:hypothetical protein|uniref:Uncharacterized protein n=1 Tax=bioreactor metagenome TaxID=1076179 RepID=A0A644TVB2_9ZZZZ
MTHILHYNTHAERRYFTGKNREMYDLVGLNGNIVSFSPTGTAAFLASISKPFYIDPQTHAFQHDTIHLKTKGSRKNQELHFKPSIVKLANDRLGEPFSNVINNDIPLSPDVFYNSNGTLNSSLITRICRNVISFQSKFLIDSIDDETRDFLDNPNDLLPHFYIAPYFFLSSILWEKWLAINIAAYRISKDLYRDKPVYLELVLSQAILPNIQDICDQIVRDIADVDGILLWIDGNAEEELTRLEVANYIHLLHCLRRKTNTIINIHGGYLSSLLCHNDLKNNLSGIGHSANYGEHREVVPVGGGIPRARFYLQKAHSRLHFSDAADIVINKNWHTSKDLYQNNVCSCIKCDELIKQYGTPEAAFNAYGDSNVTVVPFKGSILRFEYPTPEAKEAGIMHYLYNKKYEIDSLNNHSLIELLSKMESDYQEISSVKGSEFADYLEIWRLELLQALDS